MTTGFIAGDGSLISGLFPCGSTQSVQWRSSLDRVLELLAQLPALTENRFLEVGSRLQLLTDLLRTVETNATAASRLMADDSTLQSIRELELLLVSMERHFQEANRRAAAAGAALTGISQDMKAICLMMESFKGHVGNLRMLKTLTNIQSASHTRHGVGFRNVAANIGDLSLSVRSKSVAILARIAHLQVGLERAIEMVAGLEEVSRQLGNKVIATTRHQIAALASMHEKCAAAAKDVSGSSAKISQNVREIVVALQFQDITRQQLEHVEESLTLLRSDLENNGLPATEAAGLCSLQAVQLVHSCDELLAAMARLTASLASVAREAGEIAKNAHGLFRQAGETEHASLPGIETGLKGIVAAFGANREANSRLIGIMGTVAADLEEINTFAEDIDYLGSEIKMIALNAIIMAAQAGSSGAGFSVIAATVKELSEEICRQAATIAAFVYAITGHVAGLRADLENDAANEEVSTEGLQEQELAAIIVRLHSITATITDQLSLTDEASNRLAAVIEGAIAALDDREIVKALKGEAIPHLEKLTQPLTVAGVMLTESTLLIAGVEERYTMESERNIHRLFATSFSETAVGKPILSPDSYGDDNVEFF